MAGDSLAARTHLDMPWIAAFGNDGGAVLQAPPQQHLSWRLVMLGCNALDHVILHGVTWLTLCSQMLQYRRKIV